MKKDLDKKEIYEIVRLNKFISHNSNYSRREADKIIADESGEIVRDCERASVK